MNFKETVSVFISRNVIALSIAYLRLNGYWKGFLPIGRFRLLEIVPLFTLDMGRLLQGCIGEKGRMEHLKHQSDEAMKQMNSFIDPNNEWVKTQSEYTEPYVSRHKEFKHPNDTERYNGAPTENVSDYFENAHNVAQDALKNNSTLPYTTDPVNPGSPPVYPKNDRIKSSAFFNYSIPIPITAIVLTILMVAETLLYQHIVINVFHIPDAVVTLPFVGHSLLPKSLLIATMVVAITLALTNALTPQVHDLMIKEGKWKQISVSISILLVLALLLVFINSVLYYGYVEEGVMNAKARNAMAMHSADFIKYTAKGPTDNTDHLSWLRFLGISLASTLSIVVSSLLTAFLNQYKKAKTMQKNIIKLNKQMEVCYSNHCWMYDKYYINRNLVHQVLTEIKSMESIHLANNTNPKSRGMFSSVIPLVVLVVTMFSSCTVGNVGDENESSGSNVTKTKVVAIAKDNSGSIDTFGNQIAEQRLVHYLQGVSSPEQSIDFYCTSVETNMGLNNMEHFSYQPISSREPADILSENDQKMQVFLETQASAMKRDSIVDLIARKQFATLHRSPNTPLLEYLQLLSTIGDTCDIELVILSDLIQDSHQFRVNQSDLTSTDRAMKKAITDLKKMYSLYGMDSLSLRYVKSVSVILPVFQSGKGGHISPLVETYFNDILRGLGAPALKVYSE